ncbi:hypothetical protein ACNKHP_06600 [Shigella boydii]
MLAIINDVLDFSKLEAGKLILESIPFPTTQHAAIIVSAAHILLTIKGWN